MNLETPMTDRWTIDFNAQPPAWVLDALGKSEDQPGAADWDGQGDGLWVNTATRGGRLAPLGAELLRDANGGLHFWYDKGRAVAAAEAPQPAPAQAVPLTDGELWSWVRRVMTQGSDIRCDYDSGFHKGYEAYSARLDAAAAERADELMARITAAPTPDQKG